MCGHRRGEPRRRRSIPIILGGARQPCKRIREPIERHGVIGRGAAVDAGDERFLRHAGQVRHRRTDRLLQRMIEIEVRIGWQPAQSAIGQHAAVLARAVVMQRREPYAGRRRLFTRGVVERWVDAALQIRRGATRALEHIGHRLDVPRLAGVARAQERDLRRAVSEALDAAARNEGHCLQRLQRTACGREVVWIASRKKQFPVTIDHRDRSVVDAVGGCAPGHAGEGNVRRSRGSDGGRQRRGASAGNAYFSANRANQGPPTFPPRPAGSARARLGPRSW